MDEGLILETTFIVDLERESESGGAGPAHAFLDRNTDRRLSIALASAGELAAGPRVGRRHAWEGLVARFEVLVPDLEVCWKYGQTFRYLKDNGMIIGANDLWIAATGLARGLPVVTANHEHYRRVPGLEVLGYR